MQLQKAEREQINAQSSRFSQRIGSTVYCVNVVGGGADRETLEDKILRLIASDFEFGQNRVIARKQLQNPENYAIMGLLQMERLPESEVV